jgi:hypothetical protein
LEDDESSDNVLDAARDAKFLADAEQEAKVERAAHAAFDAEMKRCREAATAEEDSSDISWSSDDPDVPTLERKGQRSRGR